MFAKTKLIFYYIYNFPSVIYLKISKFLAVKKLYAIWYACLCTVNDETLEEEKFGSFLEFLINCKKFSLLISIHVNCFCSYLANYKPLNPINHENFLPESFGELRTKMWNLE